jgi:uncharacterized repeat protein (TIGR01451 family)
MYNAGTTTLGDTIVAGNTAPTSGPDASGAFTSQGNNLIGMTDGSTGWVGTDLTGTVASPLDPLLAPLGDYGGPTETVGLLPGSPAIGAGIAVPGITTDQRGAPRGSVVDIGAFQATVVVESTSGSVDTNTATLSLPGAVVLANQFSGSVITFNPAVFSTQQTIALSAQLELSNTALSTSITGPAARVIVSGGGTSRVLQADSGVVAALSGLTISGGSTTGDGGGLYNDGGTVTLTGITVSGNSASGRGGGMFNTKRGTTTIINCSISGNSATKGGGGLYNDGGTAQLTNTTLSKNSAAAGGGMANSRRGTTTIINCSISGNSAAVGGGIANQAGGGANLENTIVAANTDPGGSPSDVGGDSAPAVVGTYTLVGTGGSGGIGGGTGVIVLTDLSQLGLGSLGNYGGSTQTLPLLPGSVALGAGTVIPGISTDQRGLPPSGAIPDIGAFQSQGFTFSAVAGSTPQRTPTDASFANPLAVIATANNPLEPVAGGVVSFTVNPAGNGASASLSAATATIGANGIAQVNATANSIAGGPYTVTASADGAAQLLDFQLKNLIRLTYSGVTDQSITYGASSVTVGGTLSNGALAPEGQTLMVTLNGVQHPAAIATGGAFSTTFNTGSFGVANSPYTISYAYASDGTFASASTTRTLTVTKATPIISWANPADITYGTAISTAQLNAASTWTVGGVNGPVAGSFTYTPAVGAVLHAGTGQTLSTTFTPTDSINYTIATRSVTINVAKATPIVTWSSPADIIYGTALSADQLDAAASWTVGGVDGPVAGSFTYTPAPGTVLNAGTGRILSTAFTPTDSIDYTIATHSVTINVAKATPIATWASPADISYGTALSATQLNAAASWTVGGVDGPVAGSFTYTPAPGAVLNAGTGQTLSARFTPTDTTNYNIPATSFVEINVAKATPIMTWASPADITYGTALSATQLNAAAVWTVDGVNGPVAGSFTYTPAPGTVLNAGTGQTLSARFTPTDTTNYNIPATSFVEINVAKATPIITWASPADITYGTSLSATQLNATASWTVAGVAGKVAGQFAYTPVSGTVLNAGAGQTLSTTFTPSDPTNYSIATRSVTINVAKATPIVTWPSPADIFYGTALSATQLDATATWTVAGVNGPVAGSFTYTPASGTLLNVGMAQVLSAVFTPSDAADFSPVPVTTTLTVLPDVDLAITQLTDSSQTVQIGDKLTYTIVVVNKGLSSATAVKLTSPLGTGVSYVTGSGTATPSGTVNVQSSSVVASLGTLPPGASATITFMVIPSLIATLVGSASATSYELDSEPSNNSATVSTTVVDQVGTVEFSTAGCAVPENAGTAKITVSRVNGARGTVTVDYTTAPINAIPGLDYTPVSGTLTFPDGVTSEGIVVPVLANPYDHHDELVHVVLSNVRTTETLGHAILGAPSAATLTIQDIDPNTSPLAVKSVQWTGTAQSISRIFVTFSRPLTTSTATEPASYALVNVGRDGKYGTLDDSGVGLSVAMFQSSNDIVALTPSQPLPANQFFHLWINGSAGAGVEDVGQNLLAGDGITPGTSYTAMLARGTSLRYYTPSGDRVNLKITGGGILDDLLTGSGQGVELSVVGEVPHRTVLSGSVKRARGGTGQAYLGYTIRGLGNFGDVRIKMSSPPFQISQYPFSPSSRASSLAFPQIGGIPGAVETRPLARSAVTRTMRRPFHVFHR